MNRCSAHVDVLDENMKTQGGVFMKSSCVMFEECSATFEKPRGGKRRSGEAKNSEIWGFHV